MIKKIKKKKMIKYLINKNFTNNKLLKNLYYISSFNIIYNNSNNIVKNSSVRRFYSSNPSLSFTNNIEENIVKSSENLANLSNHSKSYEFNTENSLIRTISDPTVPFKYIINEENWIQNATNYQQNLLKMFTPNGKYFDKHSIKSGFLKNPLINFIYSYYKLDFEAIFSYSLGIDYGFAIENIDKLNEEKYKKLLNNKYIKYNNEYKCLYYDKNYFLDNINYYYNSKSNKYETVKPHLYKNYLLNLRILENTYNRQPFFGCFGYHEWAMVYSGKKKNNDNEEMINTEGKFYQKKRNLRVSQEVIDNLMENVNLKCSHFNAFRHFHKDLLDKNVSPTKLKLLINNTKEESKEEVIEGTVSTTTSSILESTGNYPLKKDTQEFHEQPGCLHATMDLFKHTVDIYPLISSKILLKTIFIAFASRTIDIRASPYDISDINLLSLNNYIEIVNDIDKDENNLNHYYQLIEKKKINMKKSIKNKEDRDDDIKSICIETLDGRKQYVKEQNSLYEIGQKVRLELINEYKNILLK